MKVSELTLDALTPFITGDSALVEYMSGPKIIQFFNLFGIQDKYSQQGLPGNVSRNKYTRVTLANVNGKPEFQSLIEALVDSRKVSNPDDIAKSIGEFIKHDGYSLEKNELGIYKVLGSKLNNPIAIQAHFEEIKSQILNSIKDARFSIWVAVAWFTDKDLGNELRKKHQAGLNIRVIVNDDQTTQKHGLDFASKGIEYTRISPDSPWGKKIMHNKFCVIDLHKVIHGSYNWTSNAQYNNESVIVTENRDVAEEFATQFIRLKSQK